MIYKLAGFLGVSPEPYTMRELVWMADGKDERMWNHTASLMAMIANTVRDAKKKSKPYEATDFLPRKGRKKADLKVPLRSLEHMIKRNLIRGHQDNKERGGVYPTGDERQGVQQGDRPNSVQASAFRS